MVVERYPKAVVFDLDYTLWPCWCDTHISMPLRSVSKQEIEDSTGMRLQFYKDVESIIRELVENNVKIIGASRTAAPRIAQEMLSLLHILDTPAIKFFDSLQWGTGSKVKHISKAARQLGMVEELSKGEFVLFDDELRNRDVASINCHFAHVRDEDEGLTRGIFVNELKSWNRSLRSSE
ncbi:magnesium-dependent phosphatase-1 [Scheffersomyces amazonensis]|uniref:magnesium-dependent phosphatase-1 n=1 Tax=Scheffersomyces amazonensis TaxID=1078765 RepID=UPI00315DE543